MQKTLMVGKDFKFSPNGIIVMSLKLGEAFAYPISEEDEKSLLSDGRLVEAEASKLSPTAPEDTDKDKAVLEVGTPVSFVQDEVEYDAEVASYDEETDSYVVVDAEGNEYTKSAEDLEVAEELNEGDKVSFILDGKEVTGTVDSFIDEVTVKLRVGNKRPKVAIADVTLVVE